MNEIPDILARALIAPTQLEFGSANEARLWVFRVHNYIRRHDPSMRQLMISREGGVVTVRVPQFNVKEVSK